MGLRSFDGGAMVLVTTFMEPRGVIGLDAKVADSLLVVSNVLF